MSNKSKYILDKKGFVFLDSRFRPFKCCILDTEPWIFYWHPDNKWVSLRRARQDELFMYSKRLSDEQQRTYDDLNNKN